MIPHVKGHLQYKDIYKAREAYLSILGTTLLGKEELKESSRGEARWHGFGPMYTAPHTRAPTQGMTRGTHAWHMWAPLGGHVAHGDWRTTHAPPPHFSTWYQS